MSLKSPNPLPTSSCHLSQEGAYFPVCWEFQPKSPNIQARKWASWQPPAPAPSLSEGTLAGTSQPLCSKCPQGPGQSPHPHLHFLSSSKHPQPGLLLGSVLLMVINNVPLAQPLPSAQACFDGGSLLPPPGSCFTWLPGTWLPLTSILFSEHLWSVTAAVISQVP